MRFGLSRSVSAFLAVFGMLIAVSSASAQCPAEFGDITDNGSVDVVDVQCIIVDTLWYAAGQVGPQPSCVQAAPAIEDVDCAGDGVNITDVQLVITLVLGGNFSAEIDGDGNDCPDACEGACSGAIPIACGETVSGDTAAPGLSNNFPGYPSCVTWTENGNELVYSFTVTETDTIQAALTNTSSDLDIFLLPAECDNEACIAFGNTSFTEADLAPGDYFIVVDGFNDNLGTFDMQLTCASDCDPESLCGDQECGTIDCAGIDIDCGTCKSGEFCNDDDLCEEFTGACCQNNGSPGCEESTCTDCVCAADSFCCNTSWDGDCADCALGGPGFLDNCLGSGCEESCVCPCGDGVCDAMGGENCETCAADCACDEGTDCTDGVCDECKESDVCAGAMGCQFIECGGTEFLCGDEDGVSCTCGNGVCESTIGEDCDSCAEDCACLGESVCEEGQCVGDVPCAPGFDPIQISCGDTVSGTTLGGTNVIGQYPECVTWTEDGPEVYYVLNVPGGGTVNYDTNSLDGVDLDTFILADTCSSANCVDFASLGGDFIAMDGVDYYVVVDGFLGAAGAFELTIECDSCGNGVCEEGETCASCALDCACEDTFECIDDVCTECIEAEICAEATGCEPITCGGDIFNCNPCPEGQWCDGECVDLPDLVGDCCASNGSAGCSQAACTTCVCNDDPFCCNTSWDGVCAGDADGGICDDVCECTCGDGVCDAEAGEDCDTCADDCACDEGDGCFDGVCEVCDEVVLCEGVTGCDPIDCGGTPIVCNPCAETQYCDGECIELPPLVGFCCESNGSAGCAEAACAACVCNDDAFCCETSWDGICAGDASVGGVCEAECVCEQTCGNGTCDDSENCDNCAEDCACNEGEICTDEGECSLCGDGICDAALNENCDTCAADCACDETTICVDGACEACSEAIACVDVECGTATCGGEEFNCGGCMMGSACFENSCFAVSEADGFCCEDTDTVFCEEPACVECVCAQDSFCCSTQWDGICADDASDGGVCADACTCAQPCGDGVCDTEGGETCSTCAADCGCDMGTDCVEDACVACDMATVCDGACGTVSCGGMDFECGGCMMGQACSANVCTDIAGTGNCCEDTGTVLCEDADCLDCVCGEDSFCCDTSYDSTCSDIAKTGACAETCECPTVGCDLDAAPAMMVSCGMQVVAADNSAGPSAIDGYSCSGFSETGPEDYYMITVDAPTTLTVDLFDNAVDIDLFLTEGSCSEVCTVVGDNTLEADLMPGVTYYLIADGFNGAAGTYSLDFTCADIQPDSCVDSCGGAGLSGDCFCDDTCEGFGDCCDDFCEICPEEDPDFCAAP